MKTDWINGYQAHPKSFFICTQGSWFDVIQANEDHSMNWWCMRYVVDADGSSNNFASKD